MMDATPPASLIGPGIEHAVGTRNLSIWNQSRVRVENRERQHYILNMEQES
jgi:hypothetical protein